MYDLVVLGAGPGGIGAAAAGAKLGARVALIAEDRPGDDTFHADSVPSRALTRVANLAAEIRQAGIFGLRVGAPEVDFPAIMARVRAVASEISGAGTLDGLAAQGVEVLRGLARFDSYDTVLLEGHEPIEARRFVIATGSRPAIPAIHGLEGAGFRDEASIWELDRLPESLVILGAGPIAVELGQAFARLGSKVTILAEGAHLLAKEDAEVAEVVREALAADGVIVHLHAQVNGVSMRDGRKVVAFRDQGSGAVGQATGAELLVTGGRLVNVEGLNLDAAGIHADARHGIEVDDYLQTRTRHIYAVGAVLGRHKHTHTAVREARIAVHNALLLQSKRIDYSAIPRVTFADPEVASVGTLDPAEAGNAFGEAKIYRASYAEADRAVIDGRPGGFIKVLAAPSGKILGATVVGHDASAILGEFVVAMENGIGLDGIAESVHPYPSYASIAGIVARQHLAERGESGLMRSALRLFHGYGSHGARPKVPAEVAVATEPAGHHAGH